MIIGINGYSGSGKDTAGIIIQYLQSETKIPLKTVLAKVPNHEWWLEERSGWEIKKWAGKLKEVASMLTGIPKHKFEDQE
jgi:thymidylate kinase